MTRRALVIGSQTPPLEGCDRDAERVAERLTSLGFVVDLRNGSKATRAGILDGYERLIHDVKAGDAAVVYYSGHGAYEDVIEAKVADGTLRRARYQSLVPVDYKASTETDFRGILAEELSLLQQRLTDVTRNVTVLLDCCHAALMSRNTRALPKALSTPVRAGVLARIASLATNPAMALVSGRPSNPFAVRLGAARIEQSAYEYEGDDGEPCGVFTESLLRALDEAKGHDVTWRDVGERVRALVLGRFRLQQPEIEGPVDRRLFEEALRAPVDSATLTKVGDAWRLGRGRVFGVCPGDVYQIVPPPTLATTGDLGRATVLRVDARDAEVAVTPRPHVTIPEGARARPLESAEPPRVVLLRAEGADRQTLRTALQSSPRFTLREDTDGRATPLATLHVSEGSLSLLDQDDAPMMEPCDVAAVTGEQLTVTLTRMARAQGLRELDGEGLVDVADAQIEVLWGRLVDGRMEGLPRSGATLTPGDAMTFRIINRSDHRVFAHLLDIGVSDAVASVTGLWQATGVEVGAKSEHTLFRDNATGNVVPVTYNWPSSVPRDAGRVEELLFLFTAKPVDLTGIAQEGVGTFRAAPTSGTSRLQQLLAQARSGAMRGNTKRDVTKDDFILRRIRFFASPWPVARDDATFLLDDRREVMEVTAPRRGAKPPPPRVAVELLELIVHANRAFFSADIRVDALFVTPGTTDCAYTAGTMRFPNVRDGDRLSLDKVLLYLGPPRDFVQVCLWVSRDVSGALSLSDLLKAQANSAEVKGALAALAALSMTTPQAALVVGAVSAATTLASVSYQLLTKAAGTSIGVYRTTLLAADGYRVGRHPTSGTLRAQDFSFSFEVRRLDA